MFIWDSKITRFLVRRALAHRLNVKVSTRTPIWQLGFDKYVEEVFIELGYRNVGDVLEAYCFHLPTPGIGEKSWEAFFSKV